MTSVKSCSTCAEIKPVEEFHRNRSHADGLASECRTCKARRARAYYTANREAITERVARRLRENPDADRVAGARRRARKSDAGNRDPGLTWRALASRDGLNCSRCGLACDPEDGQYVEGRNGSRRWRQGLRYPNVDLRVPLVAGGSWTFANATLACKSCNSAKTGKAPTA